ncbi:zinc finger Y-chromosomal protein-like [Choristoneura fumiferana]|uniref:zinc finger Y-chromosomal protein-like n=1 Tax=Choristoneura fumiferana TaxID=7141 RepID=UPI003D1562FB
MADDFVNAPFKCESCVEVFKGQVGLEKHKEAFHVEKDNHPQCPICLSYIASDNLSAHTSDHYSRHDCLLCEHQSFSSQDMRRHLKMHGVGVAVKKKKGGKQKALQADAGVKSCRNAVSSDQATPYGYPCAECNKYFENKNQRWKHVQRHHREGYGCSTCGKRFAFKNNLNRHEQVHLSPLPREQCPSCHKLVRVDLVKTHARIHLQRERFSCVECAKSFVSRASYDHHLKYTQAHASKDILKYKCNVCDKGYRSRGELRDHVNYQHIGQTQHKCPVCGKALATRRCITRHVRRAHHGVKEGPRDKICQQCGKAFRDKKGLREHEFIHTGERPLSCEVCGCTFRQSASLYTHKKRVHKIYPPRREVAVVGDTPQEGSKSGTVAPSSAD